AAEVQYLEELREIDFGQWEGKTFPEIYALDPKAVESWGRFDPEFSFPAGESLSTFLQRIGRLKEKISDALKDEGSCREIILVTHGGVIATLICLFLGLDPSQYLLFRMGRPSISELTIFGNGKGVLEKLNFGPFERRHGEWPG
ncbi:MAG: histidine phosphatase family protein, partial [Bdellovibrionia bacterium]